eukprot:14535854-Alexandrium_andersonii.AAC.1
MSASLVGSEMCIRDSPNPAGDGRSPSKTTRPHGPLCGSESAEARRLALKLSGSDFRLARAVERA